RPRRAGLAAPLAQGRDHRPCAVGPVPRPRDVRRGGPAVLNADGTLPPAPPVPRVLIVGGGLAGLAAAAALAGRGLRITLLESRPRLGGRASSFQDPATGELVDNCQHVSMTCCTNLADFCRRVGTSDLFRREPAVVFLGPEGGLSKLQAGRLP